MKKLLLAIGGLVLFGVAYWLISPFFITKRVDEKLDDIRAVMQPPPTTADSGEPSSPASVLEAILQGAFTGLAGHSGQGTAKLIKAGEKYFVRFEDDFRVTNGPDLFVYFGKDGAYDAEARVAALKGNEGGQNYEVPSSIDPAGYNEVWVWCRAFFVPFAKAELR